MVEAVELAVSHVIYVPFVPGMVRLPTFEWGRRRPDVIPYPIREDDVTGYFRLLTRVWDEWEDTIIVEQDMLPGEGVIEDMLACDQPWCTSPYRASPNKDVPDCIEGLGVVKFSAALKVDVPHLMRVVGENADFGMSAKTWKRMDVRIAGELRLNGHAPHTHGRSTHLHYERASDA